MGSSEWQGAIEGDWEHPRSTAVGKEWAVAGGLNQLESTTKLPVVLTQGASKKMVISTIVDFNLFQLENWLDQLRLIPG